VRVGKYRGKLCRLHAAEARAEDAERRAAEYQKYYDAVMPSTVAGYYLRDKIDAAIAAHAITSTPDKEGTK
jgi:hypothetical protein